VGHLSIAIADEQGCDGMGRLSIVMAVIDKVEMEWVICLLFWL
jgi:hypothetical protein